MKTTYSTKELMMRLCEILPRLDIVIASNVKIDQAQADKLDDMFGYIDYTLPVTMSMLFDNIDGHDFHWHGFEKVAEETETSNEQIYVTTVSGSEKKFQPFFILVRGNKVINWAYLSSVEHDNRIKLLEWVGKADAEIAFTQQESGLAYLHYRAPFDSREQERIKNVYKEEGFYIF